MLGFDLDDTLWDTVTTLMAAHNAMVQAAPGLPPEKASPEAFKEEMNFTRAAHPEAVHNFTFIRTETLRRLLGSDTAAEAAFKAFLETRNKPCFFPGSVEALRELKDRGFTIVAITDGNAKPREMVELKGIFDFSVNAEEAGAGKPDSRPFVLAADKAGVAPWQMIYFGDNFAKDVVGAKRTGMKAVWVRTKTSANTDFVFEKEEVPEDTSLADAEVEAVREIPGIIESLL